MSSSNRRLPPPPRLRNPFSVKVFQVFTGFGIGCGLGVGVGRPIYLGAIPALQQVMTAARGVTDVFSGVGGHVNTSIRKLGLKNIEVGIGCGVGIGHGFGVGVSLKPGVMNEIKSSIEDVVAHVMANPSMSTILSALLPSSAAGGSSTHVVRNPIGPPIQIESQCTDGAEKQSNENISEGRRSMTYERHPESIGLLPQNDASAGLSDKDGNEHTTSNVMKMVLKHQQAISELLKENEKLQQILEDNLKVPASKLHLQSGGTWYPCSDCFECRRRSRKEGKWC